MNTVKLKYLHHYKQKDRTYNYFRMPDGKREPLVHNVPIDHPQLLKAYATALEALTNNSQDICTKKATDPDQEISDSDRIFYGDGKQKGELKYLHSFKRRGRQFNYIRLNDSKRIPLLHGLSRDDPKLHHRYHTEMLAIAERIGHDPRHTTESNRLQRFAKYAAQRMFYGSRDRAKQEILIMI